MSLAARANAERVGLLFQVSRAFITHAGGGLLLLKRIQTCSYSRDKNSFITQLGQLRDVLNAVTVTHLGVFSNVTQNLYKKK